jgi:hypothetical protein
MGETLEIRAEESQQYHAMRLMKCIIANAAVAYGILDALYVELKVGGGFFRGRKMPSKVDELTRYELVGYITALTAVLLRGGPREPWEADSIVARLEALVFLPEWHAACPAYRGYVDRFQRTTPEDSAVMPPHKALLIRFRQTVIDIWGASPELLLEDGAVQRYCEAFTALHEGAETSILSEISGNENEEYDRRRTRIGNLWMAFSMP